MSGRGSGPRGWRSMKQSSYAWSRAYARQAQADLEAREALLGAPAPACQHLHFLQMACEKIAKAHRCLGGGKIRCREPILRTMMRESPFRVLTPSFCADGRSMSIGCPSPCPALIGVVPCRCSTAPHIIFNDRERG